MKKIEVVLEPAKEPNELFRLAYKAFCDEVVKMDEDEMRSALYFAYGALTDKMRPPSKANEGISMDNSLPREKQCCGNCGQVLRNRVCEAPLGPRGRGWCSYWYHPGGAVP